MEKKAVPVLLFFMVLTRFFLCVFNCHVDIRVDSLRIFLGLNLLSGVKQVNQRVLYSLFLQK